MSRHRRDDGGTTGQCLPMTLLVTTPRASEAPSHKFGYIILDLVLWKHTNALPRQLVRLICPGACNETKLRTRTHVQAHRAVGRKSVSPALVAISDGCTYLHVFQGVLLAYASQDVLLTALLQFAGEEKLIENIICFCKGEYDVEFAHVAIIFVHLFDVAVNDL